MSPLSTLKTAIFIISTIVCGVAAAPMGVGMNVWFNSYWTGDIPFTDLMKTARHFKYTAIADPGSAKDPYPFESTMQAPADFYKNIPVDTNGYPLQVPVMYSGSGYRPVTVMLASFLKSAYPVGTFTLVFEGTGRIVLGWDYRDTIDGAGGITTHPFTILRQQLDAAPSSAEKTDSRGLVLSILRSEAGDHIRNIRVILPGYADTWQQQSFTREFLSSLRPFGVVRFMDWCNANHSKISRWQDRTTPGDFPQGVAAEDMRYDSTGGVAYENMIDVCNIIQRDLWLCVPVWADTNYFQNLARLVRNRLNPSLKLYIEWGNETWNGMFEGATRQQKAWNDMPLTDQWGTGLNWESYHAYFAISLFRVMDREFAGQTQRLVKVLSGQTGNFSGVMEKEMRVLANPAYNPGNVKPDAIATTAYFSTYTLGAAPSFYSEADLQKHKDLADSQHVAYISYEGGEDRLPWSQKAYFYSDYQKAFPVVQKYFSLFNQYCFVAMSWSPSNEPWGAKQYTSQSKADAPKYRFLVDYLDSTGLYDSSEVFNPYGVEVIEARRTPQHSASVSSLKGGSPARLFDLAGRSIAAIAGRPGHASHLPAQGVFVVENRVNTRSLSILFIKD